MGEGGAFPTRSDGDGDASEAGFPAYAHACFEYLDDAVLVFRWPPHAVGDGGVEIEYLNAPAEVLTGWLSTRTVGRAIPTADYAQLLDGLFLRLFDEARARPQVAFQHGFEGHGGLSWLKVSASRGAGRLTVVLSDTTDQKENDRCLKRLHEITSDHDLAVDEKIDRILSLGAERFGTPIAIVSQIRDGVYTVVNAVSPNGEVEPGQSFDLQDTYCVHVLEAAAPVGFNHVEQSEIRDHACYKKFGLETYIGAPLVADGQPFGTLNFSSPVPRSRPFTDGELELTRLFARWIGLEIQLEQRTAALTGEIEARKRAEARLRQLATTDELTSVSNRRHFLEVSEPEFKRARRHERALSVIMLDADHFKIINDSYGHHVGDQVLRELARQCKELLRENDIIGRIGGEEFAITLPETTSPSARRVAERIREALARVEIPQDMGSLRFTVSMGISSLKKGDVDFTGLMKRADQAPYEAKSAGRNRTAVFGENDVPGPALGFGDDDLAASSSDSHLLTRRHI